MSTVIWIFRTFSPYVGTASECQNLRARAIKTIFGYQMAASRWLITMADASCPSWFDKERRAKNLLGRLWNYVVCTEGPLKPTVRFLSPSDHLKQRLTYVAWAGNCLFRALSDQLYNTTERHDEIRQNIVEYLRTNRDHFYPFVLANVEEDFIRSQPTTRSSRSRTSGVERDPFDIYLENMAKSNTWGGDIEITAFCAVYDRDVLIHRPTDAQNPFTRVVNSKRAAGQPKEYVHISFGVHNPFNTLLSIQSDCMQDEESFAHYESVRSRRAAPPPPPPPPITNSTSVTKGALCGPGEQQLSLAEYSHDPLDKIHEARPSLSHDELHVFLENSRRQLDETFSNMINTDRERSSSASSASQRSSSSKRSREDDEEDSDRTSKRTLRRVSLGNKARAFVSFTSPPSTSNGTEISFSIRVDSPPSTPTESQNSQKDKIEEGKAGRGGREGPGREAQPGKEGGGRGRGGAGLQGPIVEERKGYCPTCKGPRSQGQNQIPSEECLRRVAKRQWMVEPAGLGVVITESGRTRGGKSCDYKHSAG